MKDEEYWMKKSYNYQYSIGSTCEVCGNEYERVSINEVKVRGSKRDEGTANIPYCKQCREIKHGLGASKEAIQNEVNGSPISRNLIRILPAILGLMAYGIYTYFFYEENYNEMLGYGILIATVFIAYFVMSKLGFLQETIERDDFGSYFLEEFDLEESSDEVLKKIKSTFTGQFEDCHNNHFDRFDLFETYIKYQNTEDRLFYIIEAENVDDKELQLLEYTKNQFANPFVHILYFDNFKNKLHYKPSEGDDIIEEFIDIVYTEEVE